MIMKVVYIITSRNESILQVGPALERMGIEGVMVPTDSFHTTCSYWEHKLDKWGFHGRYDRYIEAQSQRIVETIEREQPEAVIFVNIGNARQIEEYVQALPQRCHVSMFLVDSIYGESEEARVLDFPGNHVFVYEYRDKAWLQQQGIKADYCPVGYGGDYQRLEGLSQDWDVVFVGSPSGERLVYLEKAAEAGAQRGWKMLFVGPFFEERYFWKPLSFKAKRPALFQYIKNANLPPAQVADLYRRSKICLNIQGNDGENLNPRTFEILATGGFELISHHKDYYGLLEPGRDLAEFGSPEEMVEKVAYYLEHEQERLAMAESGYRQGKDRLRMEDSLRKVLGLQESKS